MKLLTQFSSNIEISEIKISYKRKVYFSSVVITSAEVAASILRPLYEVQTIELIESFYVLFIDNANHVIGYYMLTRGGFDFAPVETRLIFALALQTGCTRIILSHNHPSGSLKPSQADINMTNKIVKCGEILGLEILDHIIITSSTYFSFADDGLM